MSWDSYIDNVVAQSKDSSGQQHVDKVCILGVDGSPWTSDGHHCALKLQGKEGHDIGKAFKDKDFTTFMSGGVIAEGTKYQFLREEDNKTVMAKKKGCGALTMQCSKTAVVVAHCPEGCQQGNTNKAVATVAEYLESMNM